MAAPSTFVPDETSDERSFSAPSSFVPDEPSQSPAVTFHDPAETIAPLSRWKSLKFGTEQALEKVFPGMAEKGSPSPVAVASQAGMIAPLGLPERLGKLLMGYFTARTAYDQPAIARQIRDEVKQGDLPAAKRTAIEDLLNVGMVGTGIMGLRGGKQPATEGEPAITAVPAKMPEGAKPATFIPETPQPIGGQNARDITSATSVLEPEIRSRVGSQTPLRQPGTPAGTQEPLVERPPQGGARADEGAAPPVEPVTPLEAAKLPEVTAEEIAARVSALREHPIYSQFQDEALQEIAKGRNAKEVENNIRFLHKINQELVDALNRGEEIDPTEAKWLTKEQLKGVEDSESGSAETPSEAAKAPVLEPPAPPATTPPAGAAVSIKSVGDKLGFTYDGDFGLGDVKLHQFTFRNLPKSDPAYGASFYAKQGASPEEILALADKKAAAFREAAPKKSAAPSSPTPSETPTAPVAPSGTPVGERQPAAAVKPAAPAQEGARTRELVLDNARQIFPFGETAKVTPTSDLQSTDVMAALGHANIRASEALKMVNGEKPFPTREQFEKGVEDNYWNDASDLIAQTWNHLRTLGLTKEQFGKLMPQADQFKSGKDYYDASKSIADKASKAGAGEMAALIKSQPKPPSPSVVKAEGKIQWKKTPSVSPGGKPHFWNAYAGEAGKGMPIARVVWNRSTVKWDVSDPNQLDANGRSKTLASFDKEKDAKSFVEKRTPIPPAETPAVEPVAAPTIKSPLSAFGKQFYKNTAGEWRQKGKPSEKVNASRVAALEQLVKPKEPAMAEVGPGLGAAKGGEPPYQPLSQLTDSLSVLAKQKPQTDSLTTAFSMGKVASAVKDKASSAINGLKAAGQYLKTKAEGYPVWNSWKAAIGDRHLALTQSVKNAEEFVRESQKTVPDKLTQEAISDYIDAGGKDDVLAKAESETKPQYQAGYTKARNLSPDEKAIADNAKDYFDRRLQDAIDHGILEDGIEDYIHRIYPAESPLKSAILSELKSGIFTGRPALAKQRVYEYDYEAEKAGLTPVKSFIKRIAAYDLSLNKAIADRQAVKAMTQIKMPDGRPMVDVGGIGTKIEGEPPKGDATLIRPSAKTSRPDDPKNDRGDYRVRDYAALKRWKWVSADGEGNPIFVKGDVLVHPDAVKQIDNLFKRSAIRQNPVGRAMLATGSTVKQTMLDLSGFHPVQITVHGWEHRTFKPVDKIDFDNHDVRGLVRGGLVVGETTGHELFSEGVSGGGSSLTRHIPVIGQKLQAYNHWLFNDYIPRLKVSTGLHALARNRAKFPKLSDDELYHLTANQMNNAFGELNYDMIGRSRTTQDVMRLALLAPDFLEARAGFAAQAATKFGSEQRTALLLGAATIYMTARIINKLLDGEYHFEPKNAFSVVVGKKAYSLRTVQGDVLKAVMEPGRFISSRLNPVYGRTLMEAFSGRDYFGRQRSGLQQLKDLATTIVPISGRGLLNPREQNLMESFLNAFGITNRRSPATADVFQLAANFKKAHNIPVEPGEFVYDPDKDPYYGIKQAAVFSNVQTTESEIKKALKAGHKPTAIWKHFVNYTSRPFAGSKKNDALFYKELSDDNKKIYADAVNERKVTIQRFKAAWHLAHQQSGEGLESESQPPSESPLSE